MGKLDFTRVECIKSLVILGFAKKKTRRGGHDKYMPPENLKSRETPFIMVPRHNKINCQVEILKELRKMGGKDLENRFIENL